CSLTDHTNYRAYVYAKDLAGNATAGDGSYFVFTTAFTANTLEVTVVGGGDQTAGNSFDVQVVAKKANGEVDGSFGTKTIRFTTTSGTAPDTCGNGNAYPEVQGNSLATYYDASLTFNGSGVATLTGFILKKAETARTITAQYVAGSISDATPSFNVANTGAVNCVKFRSSSGGGGSLLSTQNINLNSEVTAHAAGYDTYGNYLGDQSVSWLGSSGILNGPNPEVGTSTTVTAVKIGSGNLTCSSCLGSPSLSFNISAGGNSTLTWTTSSTDSESHSLLGNNNTVVTSVMNSASGDSWRTSTSGSWDNESSSATRSSRSTFPTRAFLVANSNGLDIIDATSNDLWMRFNYGSGNALDSTYGTINDVVGIGGRIFVGLSGGLTIIDFTTDEIYTLTSSTNYKISTNIANRNSGGGSWSSDTTYATNISSNTVTKLAAANITNDYVVVGTSAGVDLIQLSNKSIYSATDTSNAVTAVALSSDSKLYYFENNVGLHRANLSLPLSAGFADTYLYSTGVASLSSATDIKLAEGESAYAGGQHVVALATQLGVSFIQENSTDSSSTSLNYSAEGQVGTSGRNTATFGNALAFNGSNGYATVADGGTLTNTITVELLFQPSENLTIGSGDMVLVQKGDDATDNSFGFKFNSTTGKIDFYIVDSSIGSPKQIVSSTTTSWTAGNWYHLAATINAASGISMWVNGGENSTNAIDLSSGGYNFDANTNSLTIGGTGSGEHLKGSVDELRIMNIVQYSGSTITVPSAPHTDDAANVVHLFHFDENMGTTSANADVGANVDVTLVNSSWFTHPNLAIDSPAINAVAVVAGSGTVTGYLAADDGFIEIQQLDSTTNISVVGTTTEAVSDLDIYQIDGVYNYDVIKGLSTGGVTLVRE
ncbi:MAG: LamG domain-containing protein, partial [Bdellovibrionales bacterium]|nr:LamG domain-containing protein [Bdellovibrionales bacterium]